MSNSRSLPRTDYRDLLIRDQATEAADLTEQRNIYQQIAKGAIDALHLKTEECRRLTVQLQSLRDEHRQLLAWVDHGKRSAA